MKENTKKQQKECDKPECEACAEETADTAKEGALEEDNRVAIDIDRDSMSDEEYIGALEERLGQAIAEAQMCKGLTQRLQADFDNYRKRNAALSQEMKALGESVVIEKMLAVLDNCDLARKYIQDEAALTGFNMMETQILSALDSFGLKEIEALNCDFDAKFMTAVERVKDENGQNKVLEVVSKGYTLRDKLLRPASVKVGYWE